MRPEKPYEIDGVFRCCVASLEEADVNGADGEVVKCQYCKDGFVLRDNVWRKWREAHQGEKSND